MHVTLIAGARPNFMKIAPLIHAIQKAQSHGKDIAYRLVHTGQHYDKNMSDTFFEELCIPLPDTNLECGGGTQAEQTAHIMVAFEKELMQHSTDLVLVVGDVTSTMACSIVAKKLNTQVAHVEAGIRSWDLTMPEEINRMVTDALADLYFTTSEVANRNLRNAGVQDERIHFVGNVMIDTLLANRQRFRKTSLFDTLRLQDKHYIVLTMHRPANVDEADKLKRIMQEITRNVQGEPIIFPIHPRTAKVFADLGINAPNLHIVEPLGYLEFNYLVEHAGAVITDSGGITEETTVMGIPCITLRDNTERPETCTMGTNELIGTNPDNIAPALHTLYNGQWKKGTIPPLWDGHAAERIVDILTTL
ncbi:MAG: UDP-N-acetylglucosamine 2-epimerase (non-hydrolyzing) [Paludibacter sp.]|nr:UDP-N-acetylglucosamine 2-epimerase (non-hydrolyzing) [Bacteroidales bacterium]MCM1069062.1 UDP-N-acetylglucosamine 2-epimerase (non-hydrolyzing) [Prevotella sp.]MCM1353501.1 UDP-N-acetylglucosamine 2-epimerase (non-hydrolyzing) [Bacteroides sp.]MCM1442662.1 UDP-N-acetylglucosamine 2-epimerase (non-hydrolyzing) [Muribaculum sp.]MCM1481701.1 UDP-N-acetylglucosamine 2-epimerase (non-hydrolyzing) [Paludibacter sp.]